MKKHFRLLVLVVFAGLLLIQGCSSQKQTATNDSQQGRFDYQNIELENGLDVITLEDFSSPIVAVQIWYHVGSKDENPARQGFAHMFEHIMFRGTDRLGPTDHFGLIRSVGGSTNGYTSFDRTVYLETLPAEQLDLALWLEAERMAFLRIDQESFDTERKVVEEERRMGLNRPYGTLYENLFDEIYKVHPYRWMPIGKIPHLRAAHVQELRDFWQKYYAPSNATLVIVGAVTHEQARQAAKNSFGWIPKYDEPERVTIREPEIDEPREVTLKENNAPAPAVGVVYKSVPLQNKGSIIFDVMAEILGGGNSSRLYRELVAEKQLAVAAQAVSFSLEQDGLFGAGAVLTPFGGDMNSVLAVIEEHIDRLRSEPVTERELTKAKNQLSLGLVTGNLRIESKARMLASAAVELGDVSRVNTYLAEIRAVSADDVMRIAKEYLGPKRVLKVKIERNLLGGLIKTKEQEPPFTAERETETPPFGRPGVVRGDNFPQQPPIKQITPAKLMPEYKSMTLDNGLKIMAVENHEVPFVSVQLGLLAGGWTEQQNGAAAMALKMLTKGTENYSEGQLADELETYAISIGGSASMDTSSIGMGCLSEHTGRAMELLAEVVLRPTFGADEFEKLRRQVLTSLQIESAKAEYQAEKQFRRALYGEHPYARTATGEIEDVNVLKTDQFKKWWAENARPDEAVLIFAGDIRSARAFELAEEAFGNWQKPDTEYGKTLPEIKPVNKTHIYLVDRPGSIQSQIRMGHLGITRHDEGYFVSRVVSNYFGWAFNSRLNESVRVAKGLTYGVWGGYEASRFAGCFKIGTFSKTESTAEAVRAVIEEVEKLKIAPPSDDELQDSRTYILGSFARNRETPQQVASDIWLIQSQQLADDYLVRLLDGIARTQSKDCTAMVEKTVNPDELVIVVAGQADKLKDDLERIAPVTVVKTD